jgi:hypothetical protein
MAHHEEINEQGLYETVWTCETCGVCFDGITGNDNLTVDNEGQFHHVVCPTRD